MFSLLGLNVWKVSCITNKRSKWNLTLYRLASQKSITLCHPASQKLITGDRWRLEKCNSVIFRLIFKSKTPLERSIHNLNVDTLFLKIRPEMALRPPFKVGQCIKIAMFLDGRSIAILMLCPILNGCRKAISGPIFKTRYLCLDYKQDIYVHIELAQRTFRNGR